MVRFVRTALAAAFGLLAAGPAMAAVEVPACLPEQGRMVQSIAGELGGGTREAVSVGRGWTFAFEPADYGWDVRLYDDKGIDLSAMTPPLRGAPNPRELYGWHFRNAGNTGSNDGSVNAPQTRRAFVFDPGLSEKGPFDPSSPGADPANVPGRGLLTVLDYGLANLEKDDKARLVFLKFHVCLSWPESEAVLEEAGYGLEDKEVFAACGLEAPFALSAFLRPKTIGGDFDGDGANDVAAPVADMATGKRALAICRAGTRLDFIGYDTPLGELVPAYLDHVDWWRLEVKGTVSEGAGGADVPTLVGDAITIGKDDSSSVLVYWDGAQWASYWQGD